MILVDTSVWIDFFRGRAPELAEALDRGEVVLHPWVLGELTLGQRGARWSSMLRDLALLPQADVVSDDEVLAFIEARHLGGKGIGWVDAQLLAAALSQDSTLWSVDKRLTLAARTAGLTTL